MAILGDRGDSFGWLDFARQTLVLQRARIPRWGGVEAEPKTGRRLVDCSYAPEIFQMLERIRDRQAQAGGEDFVFVDSDRRPLSQEWLNKRIWQPTLRRAGMRERGQYCIRDTFITLSLSAGEDPGWVARVCGTSEQMIFRHYRNWIPGFADRRRPQNQRGSFVDYRATKSLFSVPQTVPRQPGRDRNPAKSST
jgi:integrase